MGQARAANLVNRCRHTTGVGGFKFEGHPCSLGLAVQRGRIVRPDTWRSGGGDYMEIDNYEPDSAWSLHGAAFLCIFYPPAGGAIEKGAKKRKISSGVSQAFVVADICGGTRALFGQ